MARAASVTRERINMNYQIGIPSSAKTIFRAYDIRGIVGETLTQDALYTLGIAIGSQAQEQNQTAIVVGRDGRLSRPGASNTSY